MIPTIDSADAPRQWHACGGAAACCYAQTPGNLAVFNESLPWPSHAAPSPRTFPLRNDGKPRVVRAQPGGPFPELG